MSTLPQYEKVAQRGPSLDVERHNFPSVESSRASQVAIPIPPPLPWRDDEVRRPITYRFVAPSQWRFEGSECAGVLGRTREETIGMIRRAFPKECNFIPDERFVLSTHDAEGLWLIRLAPDWFEMMAQRRLQPPTLFGRFFENDCPKWPTSITVEVEPSPEEAARLKLERSAGPVSHIVGYAGLILLTLGIVLLVAAKARKGP